MGEFTMHGPMYQFECETCGRMGDCWDSEAEADADMKSHDCLEGLPYWARNEIKNLRSAGDAMYSTISDIPIQRFDSGLGVINAMLAWDAARKRGKK